MDDHVMSMFALSGGGSGIVHADFLRPDKAQGHGDDRVRLASTRGIMEVRNGVCLLTTHTRSETNITGWGLASSMHRKLPAAFRGKAANYYSTAAFLEMAELLLQARDWAERLGHGDSKQQPTGD